MGVDLFCCGPERKDPSRSVEIRRKDPETTGGPSLCSDPKTLEPLHLLVGPVNIPYISQFNGIRK